MYSLVLILFSGLLTENSQLQDDKRQMQRVFDSTRQDLEEKLRQLTQQLEEQQVSCTAAVTSHDSC